MNALTQRWPTAATIPYLSLGALPTPVEALEPLGEALGLAGLWVKRDDLSGALYGGNKVRKLEFLLAEAHRRGHCAVWTVGAIGSHHALATCLYARELGMTPQVLHFPQPVTEHVREVLKALSTTAPELTLLGHRNHLPAALVGVKIREMLATHPDVFYIAGGGSSPVGVLGYVNAALELAEQIAQGQCPEPDTIVVAAGSGGTQAGLALGVRMAGLRTRVVGIRVIDRIVAHPRAVAKLANQARALLVGTGVPVPEALRPQDIEMVHDCFGPGYGMATPAGERAKEMALRLGGLELDPTYTAKAFSAITGPTAQALGGPDLAKKRVLYWHTLSGADLSERIARADIARDLPATYQAFFRT